MRLLPAVVAVAALSLSACTSMRITGTVTDQRTGEPITHGGVVSGPRSAPTDFLGRYVIGVDRSWKTMQVIAKGYEPKNVSFESASSRYPIIDIQMSPKPGRPGHVPADAASGPP